MTQDTDEPAENYQGAAVVLHVGPPVVDNRSPAEFTAYLAQRVREMLAREADGLDPIPEENVERQLRSLGLHSFHPAAPLAGVVDVTMAMDEDEEMPGLE